MPARPRPLDVHRGISLLETLVVVVVLGILAVIVVPRFGTSSANAKKVGCHVNIGNIEVQSSLWYRNKSSWPATDLSDIFADSAYFPDGATTCPVDGTSYTIDAATGKVVGHAH